MFLRYFRPGMLVLAGCLAAGAAFAQGPKAQPDAGAETETQNLSDISSLDGPSADLALEAYVDGLIATWQTVHGAPGYSVAVVRPDRVVLAKGYGLADVATGQAVDPANTRFHVASISKTFVWTSVMMLVERGVLDLDADVNAYLTRYRVPDGERPLTLADLLHHRAGVEENLELWTPAVADMDLPDAIAASEPAQVFPRGDRAAYSNWGSNLAALIVEDVTDRTYGEFLQDEILTPLGMTTTALTDQSPAAQSPYNPISQNYQVGVRGPKQVPQIDLGAFAPIGGMTTTAQDMTRWLQFHLRRGELDGVRLLSEATYADMRTRRFDPVPGAAGRAHGFADLPYRSTRYYGHTGSINAFFSKFAVAPELGLGVFIAQNTGDRFDPLGFVPRLVFDRELALRGELDWSGSRPTPTEDDVAEANTLAGTYITSRRVFHGPQKLLSVFDGTVKLTAAEGYLTGSRSHAPYVKILPDVWENRHGERIAFVRDESGKPARLLSPSGGAYEPVTLLNNPLVLAGALGAVALFSLTTWLGLWRRFRQQYETRIVGKVMNWISVLATLPMIWIGVLASNISGLVSLSFAEVFTQWPPPLLSDLTLAATVATGVAGLMALCVIPVWLFSGWAVVRKVHFSLFALAYAVLGVSLINWGMTPLLT